MSEQGDAIEERTVRSLAACNVCRAKKQKCSGEKPSCARCRTLGRECIWPQKQKRGPTKGYIEALEARLCDTEEVLSRLLTYLSADEVSEALLRSDADATKPLRSYSSLLLLDRKQAVGVWTNFPLKTGDDVLRWHRERGECGRSESALVRHPRSPAEVQSAADFGDMLHGPRQNDRRLQSVDDFTSIGQRPQQRNANDDAFTMRGDLSSTIDVQGHWQSSMVRDQSRMQPHPQSLKGNSSLGLSQEFQESFLW